MYLHVQYKFYTNTPESVAIETKQNTLPWGIYRGKPELFPRSKLCIDQQNNKCRAKCPSDSENDNHPQLNPVKAIFQAGPFKCSIAGALLGMSTLGTTHWYSIVHSCCTSKSSCTCSLRKKLHKPSLFCVCQCIQQNEQFV